jgi:hypothetical protein
LAGYGTQYSIDNIKLVIFPALHRMEQNGWIASEWALTETNRKAKYYKLTKAACHLVPAPRPSLTKHAKWQSQCVRFLNRMQCRSTETPPCLQCKIFALLPKRFWPSREQAKTVRRRQNDPHLAVYECPFNKDSGTWAIHLERQPL